MFGVIGIIVFFVVLGIVVNPHIRKSGVAPGGHFDEERGVSLNRHSIVGRSLCDPIDQQYFDDF